MYVVWKILRLCNVRPRRSSLVTRKGCDIIRTRVLNNKMAVMIGSCNWMLWKIVWIFRVSYDVQAPPIRTVTHTRLKGNSTKQKPHTPTVTSATRIFYPMFCFVCAFVLIPFLLCVPGSISQYQTWTIRAVRRQARQVLSAATRRDTSYNGRIRMSRIQRWLD